MQFLFMSVSVFWVGILLAELKEELQLKVQDPTAGCQTLPGGGQEEAEQDERQTRSGQFRIRNVECSGTRWSRIELGTLTFRSPSLTIYGF